MTCEKPSESERPISHWSQREIADKVMRRGLVPSISQRSVGRFLKRETRPICLCSFRQSTVLVLSQCDKWRPVSDRRCGHHLGEHIETVFDSASLQLPMAGLRSWIL